jgi:hypothetical protein
MSLLGDETVAERAQQHETFRLTNVSSKLTRSEAERLDELAKKHGQQRGEFILQLILDELARESGEPTVSTELTEIIGLRLMLTNLLRPLATGQKLTPETFDGIIAEVKKHKRTLAVQTQTDLELRRASPTPASLYTYASSERSADPLRPPQRRVRRALTGPIGKPSKINVFTRCAPAAVFPFTNEIGLAKPPLHATQEDWNTHIKLLQRWVSTRPHSISAHSAG